VAFVKCILSLFIDLTYYCFSGSWLTLNKVGKYPTDTFVEDQHDDNQGDAEIVTQL
jgi:hypothetical protein